MLPMHSMTNKDKKKILKKTVFNFLNVPINFLWKKADDDFFPCFPPLKFN